MDKYEKALEYEIFIKKEYSFADEIIKKAKVIFDIGGHIGLFSKYCLSINPGCEIHYFEPIPSLYNQAKQEFKNLPALPTLPTGRQAGQAGGRQDQNVLLNNIGIAKKTGQQKIYYNSQKTMQSSKFNQTFLNPKGEEIIVQMQNLEEYCMQQNISHIDLLKLDVEGMEYEILESLSDEFLQKIQAMILEYHCFNNEMERKLIILRKNLSRYFLINKIAHYYDSRLGYLLCLLR